MSKFLEKYKRLGDYEYENDELQAGIKKLEAFGAYGVMVSLARKTNMRPRDIGEMAANEVYTMLLLDFEHSQYEKRLIEIKRIESSLGRK